MNPPRSTARINGRSWTIEFVDALPDAYGLCDHADRRISIRRGPVHQMQDALFHEFMHAACPTLSEKTVAEIERGGYAVLSDNADWREWIFREIR